MATGWGGLAFAIVMGLLWGSFANVCIYRWPPTEQFPKGRSVVKPGSHCFVCGAQVRWYDNVPILAWLWLRGRCRDCGATFSARYLWVEALTGLLFGLAWWQIVVEGAMFEPLPARLVRCGVIAAFAVAMVVIAFIDLDHKLILDKVTYPAIPVFYGLGLLIDRTWSEGLIGAAIGYGVIRAVSDGYYYLTGREGLGYGDGKLLAIVGALAGWRAVLFSLFAGSVLGTIFGVTALALRGRGEATADADEGAADTGAAEGGAADTGAADTGAADTGDEDAPASFRHIELPFGPYLAAAAMFYVLAEPWLRINLWFLRG